MAAICAFETLSDVSNRRLADIAGHDRGRLTWAESDGWPNGGNRRDNAAARGVANGREANLGKGDVARFGAGHSTGSPGLRQGELLATQNPDGSLVFSAVLNDGQGLLSFLLVPPSAERTPQRQRHVGRDLPSS